MTDEIRTALSCGWLRVAGAGQVDGVSAVKLTGTPGGVTATIWVSASTYLPVRITTTWPTYVLQDTQWLPPPRPTWPSWPLPSRRVSSTCPGQKDRDRYGGSTPILRSPSSRPELATLSLIPRYSAPLAGRPGEGS